MRTSRTLAAAVLAAGSLLAASPAQAFGGPNTSPTVMHNDHFLLCATDIQGWVTLPVQANDVAPPDTRITATDQPNQGHGQAQIIVGEDSNTLQYRNTLGPLGTDYLTYEVHYPSGVVDTALWKVTVDRYC